MKILFNDLLELVKELKDIELFCLEGQIRFELEKREQKLRVR